MKTFKLMTIDSHKTLSNHHVNEYINSDGDHYSDLISYTTRVASYNHTTNEISVYSCPSNTTAKHINAFLAFYGFDTMKKSEILKLI